MKSYCQAMTILPQPLRMQALKVDGLHMGKAEELRMRVGRRPSLVLPDGEWIIPGTAPIEPEDIKQLVELASRWSLHTVLDRLCGGYITVEGGHRLGLCGCVVMEQGEIRAFRDFSGANLRIARQIKGAAEPVLEQLRQDGRLENTLILAPPGAGKTTLLRDLIRALSDGEDGMRVGVVDERGELAAVWQGAAQMELGRRTDVLSGCPKALGMELMLRGMSPQVLAVDEITAPRDVQAMSLAAGCGVALLATAHANGREDLSRRTLYRELLSQGIFRKLVTIRVHQGRRVYRVEELT